MIEETKEGDPSRKMEEDKDGDPSKKLGEEKKDSGLTCWQRTKNFFAVTKPDATPLEWSIVMVTLIGLVRETHF